MKNMLRFKVVQGRSNLAQKETYGLFAEENVLL